MYDYEENKGFSWTNLFIKVIIVLIFILFTVWLLSLSNKKVSNSLDIITDNVFSENINKMKEVGKDYFTTERLPEKVGDVKKITLEEMYNKKMLLTLKDKNGKTCSSKNSYVSIEKKDNEYLMKVYLECGKNSDYVVVTMGCYNYCSTDICEKKNETDIVSKNTDTEDNNDENVNDSNIEYQYAKSTGGNWSDWSGYSNWSTTSVTKTDYRDVETKVVDVDSIHQTPVTEVKFMGNSSCPSVSGYTLTSNVNGVCTYSKTTSDTTAPKCPSVSGYTYMGMNGFTCNYSKTTSDTTAPKCPSVSGYTYMGMNGFTCNYSKTTSDTTAPKCPSVSGYTYTGMNGFTCNYSKTTTSKTEYTLSYYSTGSGSYVPADTSTYHYVQKSADYVYKCDSTCGMRWYYTYTIYKKIYKTVTDTTTKTASCPSGYYQSESTCAKSSTSTTTKTASCPSGYYQSGSTCAKNGTSTITKTASCPSDQSNRSGKCYKVVSYNKEETITKKVTYYRYRTRNYVGGTTDYKWSSSKNDKQLLDAGYKLTGKTRNKEIGGK